MFSGTNTRAVRPAALLVIALATGNCIISAEGELPDVEVTERDVAIPAAPLEADGSDVAISVVFKQKPARAGLPKDSFSEVRVLSVGVTAKSGISDLAFLKGLRVTATSAEATAAGFAPVEIARFERNGSSGAGPTLLIAADPPADVTALWKSTEVVFTLAAVGQMPTTAWTADVGMRFGATISY
jgi:hypothetical protein